ncbi:MAG: stage III sporulation protein AE [Clostridia bacterium]|nr:stage III sporulation protein AE [Clostridia bacterium]
MFGRRIVWIIFLSLWLGGGLAQAEGWESQFEQLDSENLTKVMEELQAEWTEVFPGGLKTTLGAIARGEMQGDLSGILAQLGRALGGELWSETALLGKLLVLALICAFLQNLSNALSEGAASALTRMVAFLVLAGLAIGAFGVVLETARETMEQMTFLMEALMPLLLTLLVAVGGVTSAGLFQPLIITGFTILSGLIKNLVLPFLFMAALVGLIGYISPQFSLNQLSGLFKKGGLTLLGIFITIFSGLLALQGVSGAVGDGIGLRVAKYTTSAVVPVVGSMFSGAMETIVSSSLLIKNSLGLLGMLAAILILLWPLLKILVLSFIFRLAGALIEPVGDNRLSACLNDLGGHLTGVFAALAVVGLMFFLAVAMVVAMGNLTVMLR